ncbi:Arginine--tRNA ligase [Kitasatospora sp. MMS16-BH015]|uniref:arginine--tRNA ligase n=1 Tax=Kitasatospora sp. MMS16-BH015 TaxID=2018025 RepID=UPI000CA3C0F5|nr:arginine--tRNA ligase [Kitasatospora sp. MMS16-BH015]AUG75252.1 Arginine--tRNA ligase [Kitasatospora sp. MMS16-BH015]
MVHTDVSVELGRRVARAVGEALGLELDPEQAVIRPSRRAGVDYQTGVAMALAARLGRAAREVAEEIAAALDAADLVEPPEVSGKGFLNLVLRADWLAARASALPGEERLGVPLTEAPRRIALDYSSPNVAKEMHVGHLRSTVLGDAIGRLLRFAGHQVIPHNHIGDWGTPFGMLIEHLVDEGLTEAAGAGSIGDLNGFYQEARKKFDAEPEFASRARRRVVLLQGGHDQTLTWWRRLVEESAGHFEQVYRLLGIELTPADVYGESFYNPFLADLVKELGARRLTRVSGGAVCTFPEGFTNRDGDPLAVIVRKRGGGYGYAATDLAAARYWLEERGATDLLYVVGSPQAQHFALVFAVLREAGWLMAEHHAEHIGFGSVLGSDGRAVRTRAGGSVKLVDLLVEAVDRAAEIAEPRALPPGQQAAVARAVGIGAVKYADLAHDRRRDYLFDWDRMLAMDGNTAVYLQYANCRARSVLRAAGAAPAAGTPVLLTDPRERALLLRVLEFPAAVSAATRGHAPHKLCTHLYATARSFSAFYAACPILAAGAPELRASRLLLAALASRVLTLGLSLLGIETPEKI